MFGKGPDLGLKSIQKQQNNTWLKEMRISLIENNYNMPFSYFDISLLKSSLSSDGSIFFREVLFSYKVEKNCTFYWVFSNVFDELHTEYFEIRLILFIYYFHTASDYWGRKGISCQHHRLFLHPNLVFQEHLHNCFLQR